jgi:hypothetical protein
MRNICNLYLKSWFLISIPSFDSCNLICVTACILHFDLGTRLMNFLLSYVAFYKAFQFFFNITPLQIPKNFRFRFISPLFSKPQDEVSHSSSQKCPLESSPHHINELSQLLMSNLTCETTFKKKKKLYKQSRKL